MGQVPRHTLTAGKPPGIAFDLPLFFSIASPLCEQNP